MFEQLIAIYCICDEVLNSLNIQEDSQCKMSNAEVMTFALMSALLYGCNYRKARLVASHNKYFRKILSHSQLVRRIHLLPEHSWQLVFLSLQVLLGKQSSDYFIVDSFPVKAYENHKSFRARIFSGKEFHGYSASKKQYFFGIKVHMIIDSNGIPVEVSFTPGSHSDISELKKFELELPDGAWLIGDKAYTAKDLEGDLMLREGIKLVTKKRRNMKRQNTPEEDFIVSRTRNYIETVFSSITSRMPRYIKARTEKGFCLKVFFFVLAYMLNIYYPIR